MDIFQIAGILGAIVYLCAYGSLQMGIIKGNSIPYATLNIVAASLVLVSMLSAFNMGSAIIQGSFITLSFISIVRFTIAKIPPKVTIDERDLAEALLPGIPLRRAMSVLRKGSWDTIKAGVLTREGAPLDGIYYLSIGTGTVSRSGFVIGMVGQKEIIGDMGVLSNCAASATVTLTQASRVFRIDADVFRKALEREEDIRISFQNSAFRTVSARLNRANNQEVPVA